MATMFRDFSFAPVSPPAYSGYEAERAAMHVSPTSPTIASLPPFNRPPTPPCTMGDLAVQLKQQSLRIDARSTQHCLSRPASPPSDDGASPTEQTRPPYSRVAASLLRMQRQASSRMQCSPAHVRDIAQLVHMIEEQEQCTINEATSRTSSASSTCTCTWTTSGDDEGVGMDSAASSRGVKSLVALQTWRSGARRDSCTRVIKPVRMRKRSDPHGVDKRRSS